MRAEKKLSPPTHTLPGAKPELQTVQRTQQGGTRACQHQFITKIPQTSCTFIVHFPVYASNSRWIYIKDEAIETGSVAQ